MKAPSMSRAKIGASPADLGRRLLVRHRLDSMGMKHQESVGVLDRWSGTGKEGILRLRQRDGFMMRVDLDDVDAIRVLPPETSAFDLQEVAEASWPAREFDDMGRWRMRWTDGVTTGANSVRVGGSPGRATTSALERVTKWYRERGGMPMLQVPSPSAYDEVIESAGWTVHRTSIMLVNSTSRLLTTTEAAADRSEVVVSLSSTPDDQWWSLVRDYSPQTEQEFRDVLLGTPERVFASCTAAESGELLGIGRGTLVSGWAGATSMETAPHARRRGVASSIMAALARWSADMAVEQWFLQVFTQALPALSLYDSLGFTEHHRYAYRQLLETPDSAAV